MEQQPTNRQENNQQSYEYTVIFIHRKCSQWHLFLRLKIVMRTAISKSTIHQLSRILEHLFRTSTLISKPKLSTSNALC